jgi:hypothetical protein
MFYIFNFLMKIKSLHQNPNILNLRISIYNVSEKFELARLKLARLLFEYNSILIGYKS